MAISTAREQAPSFSLVNTTLEEVTLSSLSGFRKVINIFPSIDTPTCATSVRKFNEKASNIKNTRVLCISPIYPLRKHVFAVLKA